MTKEKLILKVAKNASSPSSVRYDERLSKMAKLLYPEIAGLSFQRGFCYASNEYFAKLMQCSTSTIKRAVYDLIDKSHISRELMYRPGTHEVAQRRLHLLDKEFAQSQNIILIDSPYYDEVESYNESELVSGKELYLIGGVKNEPTPENPEIGGVKNELGGGVKNELGVGSEMSYIPITDLPSTSLPFTDQKEKVKKEKEDSSNDQVQITKRDALKKKIGKIQFELLDRFYDLQQIPVPARNAFVKYLAYRLELKKVYKAKSSMSAYFNKFLKYSPEVLEIAVDNSISNQYSGFFPDRIEKEMKREADYQKKKNSFKNGNEKIVEPTDFQSALKAQLERRKEAAKRSPDEDFDFKKIFEDHRKGTRAIIIERS